MSGTAVEVLRRELVAEEGQRAYNARLLAVLGDGRHWEYTGVCVDLQEPVGKCSCGHPIRFEYWLRHKEESGRQAVVGSECVNHFEIANPDTFARLSAAVEATKTELAEKERAARAAEQQARNTPLEAEWKACREVFSRAVGFYREAGRWVPENLYWARCPAEPPEYQRAADYGRWYADQVKRLRAALAGTQWERELPEPAEVPDLVKRYKGREFRQDREGRWTGPEDLQERHSQYRSQAEGGTRVWWERAVFASWAEAKRALNGALAGSSDYYRFAPEEGRGEGGELSLAI